MLATNEAIADMRKAFLYMQEDMRHLAYRVEIVSPDLTAKLLKFAENIEYHSERVSAAFGAELDQQFQENTRRFEALGGILELIREVDNAH